MDKKKIAIIDWVGKKAGMDYYDISLLEALSTKSVETYLFSNFDFESSSVQIKKVFKISSGIKMITGFVYFLNVIRSILKCKKKGINYIILHIFSASFFFAFTGGVTRLFGIKLIAVSHDVSSFAGDDKKFLKKIIYSYLVKYIIVHNRFSFNELVAESGDNIKEKIHIIPQGNYLKFTKKIPRSDALRELNLSEEKKYILFFGQIKKVKGLDILLRALPNIDHDVELIIAGRPWKDNFLTYQKLIDKLDIGERVKRYIRYIDDNERDLFFNAGNLLIIPYSKIYQSAVLLFGMSYGLPVLASDLEPIRELINPGVNGFLFKTGDSGSLQNIVNSLIFEDVKLKKAGEEAGKLMEVDFSWNNIAKKYLDLLNK